MLQSLLDEFDKQQENRGHSYVRYEDNFSTYIGNLKSCKNVV